MRLRKEKLFNFHRLYYLCIKIKPEQAMKKLIRMATLPVMAATAIACSDTTTEQSWIVDRFDDIKVIRYEVPGFEALPVEQKELIYYLQEAAKWGRDILFDQNCAINLPVRRTLECIYLNYEGDRTSDEWKAVEKYLKKVWFANGIHHHYSNDKFRPEFSQGYFEELIASVGDEKFGELTEWRKEVLRAIFDETAYPTKLNQKAGDDLLLTSSSNYYSGVTQAEAEAFYTKMAKAYADDPQPISFGLNSQLTKNEKGELVERVWYLDGMYGKAIEQIIYWLEKAHEVAAEPQKTTIGHLINYYRTGDLKQFDAYNIAWVKDVESNVDFVNGFIEDYGDALGRKASWESIVNFKDVEACLGQLEGSLIGQGAGAGNNAYMALLVDVARDNAQLCLVYGQDTRAVRADQAGLLASHVSTNLDHILNRHMLGDADYQIQACLNALHDGVSSEARRYEYYGSGSAGSLNSILYGVEYRHALYYLASLARSYTGNNLGTVFQHLLGVEHCSLAGNTLYDNFCIFI